MDLNNTKTIKYATLGNGLTPIFDTEADEVLISISSPLLILVEKEALDKVCSYCFVPKQNADLKRCNGCKVPRYCSTACQKVDWALIHQKECSILKKMPGVPPTAVRGLIQLCLRNAHPPGLDTDWVGLEGHLNELRQSSRWDQISLQSTAAVEYSKSPKNWVEWTTNLLCRVSLSHSIYMSILLMTLQMSTNAFRVALPDQTPIGICFSPALALANHSCSPNAAISFSGRTISLRSLNKIKSGEQIFISYIDPVQARETRRAELKERYFFTCECDVCKKNENPYQTFLRTLSSLPAGTDKNFGIWWESEKLKDHAGDCKSNAKDITNATVLLKVSSNIRTLVEESRVTNDPAERFKKLKEALRFIRAFARLQTYAIIPLPMIVNELYLHHVDTGAYVEALILMLFLSMHCDPFTYPQPTHPVRILHLYTIAKLLKHIASLDTDELLPPDSTPFNEDQRQTIRNIDYVSAVQVFLILVKELAVKDGRFMKEVEEELVDVETVQKERNGGGAGLELRRWMVQGSMAVEGKLMAETVVGGLRDLVGFVGRVIEELDAGGEDQGENSK